MNRAIITLCLVGLSAAIGAELKSYDGQGPPFKYPSSSQNKLPQGLAIGDVVSAWGTFKTGTSKFTVNLMENKDKYMLHVDFRLRPGANEDNVVLNSKPARNKGWEKEIRTKLPAFKPGHQFRVDIKCLEKHFEISVDGKKLVGKGGHDGEKGPRFPYRPGYALKNVRFVTLVGGSKGLKWNYLALPRYYPGWSRSEGKYLSTYSSGTNKYTTFQEAQRECASRSDCGGITYETETGKKYTLRKGSALKGSPTKEVSWMINTAGYKKYEVVIATHTKEHSQSKKKYSGNYIKMYGSKGSTNEVDISKSREKGKTDLQYVVMKDVGNIKKVDIKLRGSDGWRISRVIIYEKGVEKFDSGPVEKWMDNVDRLHYKITTLTSVAEYGNVALKKPTSQSSTGWSGHPGRAVDGNTNTKWNGKSCSHTARKGWWRVDLQKKYKIKKIVIYNRSDCCSERIEGVKVYAGDHLCGTIKYKKGQMKYEIGCDATASFVKVDNPKTYLTLCEVEVEGLPVDNCVKENWDYWGADIKNLIAKYPAKNIYSCLQHCKLTPNCKSVAFKEKDGRCWLKRKQNGARSEYHSGGVSAANLDCASVCL